MRREQHVIGPSREAPEFGERFRLLGEFRFIPLAEFLPAFGLMTEPLAERSAGGQHLGPMIDRGVFVPQTSWPQAIDEDARSVSPGGWFVDTLQLSPWRIGCLADNGLDCGLRSAASFRRGATRSARVCPFECGEEGVAGLAEGVHRVS